MMATRQVEGHPYTPSGFEIESERFGRELGMSLNTAAGDFTTIIRRFSDLTFIDSRRTADTKVARLLFHRRSPLHYGALSRAFEAASVKSVDSKRTPSRADTILNSTDMQKSMMLDPNQPTDLLSPLELTRFPERLALVVYDQSQFKFPETGGFSASELQFKGCPKPDLEVVYSQVDLYRWDGGGYNAADCTDSLVVEVPKKRVDGTKTDLLTPEDYTDWLIRSREHPVFRPDMSKISYEFPADTPSSEVIAFMKEYFFATFQRSIERIVTPPAS
ncbi:hypothetical protein M1437_03585 [Patescibacteria group bacterium]|nr:hypothetical protein [Patescibacteria group bacterium]